MAYWFLLFVIYSLLGCGLEKIYAYITESPKQTRKCFLLLPLCPVYGLSMTTVTTIAPVIHADLIRILIFGAVCTLTEYLVHLFYDRLFGVRFWDYSALHGNVKGRICPQFAAVWGILSTLAVRYVHPAIVRILRGVPLTATFLLWIIFAADCALSAALLARHHDTEALSLTVLLSSGAPTTPERHEKHTDGSSR